LLVDFDDTRLLAEKAKRMMNNTQEKSKFSQVSWLKIVNFI
jgi:hypothetical protein